MLGIIRFKNNGGNALQSLFSISDKSHNNDHFHVYIQGTTIGYELRKESNEGYSKRSVVNQTLNSGINTIAFKAEKR